MCNRKRKQSVWRPLKLWHVWGAKRSPARLKTQSWREMVLLRTQHQQQLHHPGHCSHSQDSGKPLMRAKNVERNDHTCCTGIVLQNEEWVGGARRDAGRPLRWLQSSQMVAPLEWRGVDGFEKYLKGRVVREISVISDMQMTPPLWQKVKMN